MVRFGSFCASFWFLVVVFFVVEKFIFRSFIISFMGIFRRLFSTIRPASRASGQKPRPAASATVASATAPKRLEEPIYFRHVLNERRLLATSNKPGLSSNDRRFARLLASDSHRRSNVRTVSDLQRMGLSEDAIRQEAKRLLLHGYTVQELLSVKFTPAQIKAALPKK